MRRTFKREAEGEQREDHEGLHVVHEVDRVGQQAVRVMLLRLC